MNPKRFYRLLPFLCWPIIASAISFLLQLNMLYSTLVFLAIPAIYLSFLLPKLVKKAFLFSTAITIPFSIVVDYIAHFTGQWLVLNETFPRFLNYISVEDVIWVVLFSYFVIMFYEYFVESKRKNIIWHSRMKILAGFSWGLLFVFLICLFINQELLNIPYFYLYVGLLFMAIPSVIELFRRPNLLPKFFTVGSYFFFLTFIYELTALKLGQWTFPSEQYIGWVSIAGLNFPFEEFFFGFFFYSMITLTCYEAFDDDEQ